MPPATIIQVQSLEDVQRELERLAKMIFDLKTSVDTIKARIDAAAIP